MKNSRKTNVKSNTSDIEAKEKKEQQEQEKILAAKYLIELIRSVLEERKPQPKPEQISMKCLFLTAKKHNLACMAYDAAKQIAGEEDKEVMEAWQNYNRTCMIMSAVQGKEGERLLERFSDNQVRVLPLKGWIMRRFYPKPEYRQMTDLDFLIDEENEEAIEAVELLSDLLRYQLYDINTKVTIEEEIDYLRTYIQFQRLRMTKRLQFEESFDPELTGQKIHPLLFLPLLENAFKYVGEAYWIQVSMREEGSKVCFGVSNTFNPDSLEQRKGKGIGIDNLRKRLELLYPDKHELRIKKDNTRFRVELCIDLSE